MLLGKYSAHINPAVTLASALSGAVPRTLLIPYVSFQIVGGLLAGLTLRFLFGSMGSAASLGSTKLAPQISLGIGILLEAFGTLLLTLVVLTSSSLRRQKQQAFLVGATLFVLILLIGPLTGASFNPARTLGPAVASGYLTDLLVYWIGPLSGGLIAALLFSMFQASGRKKDGREQPSVCMC